MVTWTKPAPVRTSGRAAIGIESLAHFEAPIVVTPAQTAYLVQLIPEAFRATFTTPDAFRRFEPNPLASELAAAAVSRSALDKAGLTADDIDCVIGTSFVAHWQQWMPAFGSQVHHALGLKPSVALFNIQSQCASFADALRLAWQLVDAGRYRRVLIVAATQALNEADPSDPVAAWAGDGATAAVVSTQSLQAEFIGYDYFAVGALHRDYRMRLRERAFPGAVPAGAPGDDYGFWAVRDLGALLKWMGADFAAMLSEGLARAAASAALQPRDIDMVFFHQMGPRNQVVLLSAGEILGMPREAFRETFNEFGCAGNVDGPITMSLMLSRGEIKPGMTTLLHASGVGGANTAIVLRWLHRQT